MLCVCLPYNEGISYMYTYIPSLLPLPLQSHLFRSSESIKPNFPCFPPAIYFTHGSVYVQRRQWHPTPVLLPGKSHRWTSLVGCKEPDTTKWLHFHFSLSCIGKGNGNPLQHSCLENPRDGGAWWAAVYGVAQSRTRLKRLSSSSSYFFTCCLVLA